MMLPHEEAVPAVRSPLRVPSSRGEAVPEQSRTIPPCPAGNAIPDVPRTLLALVAARALLTHVQLPINQKPRSLFLWCCSPASHSPGCA